MKLTQTLILTLLLTVLAVPALAQDFVAKGHPKAFRGYEFGGEFSSMEGLSPVAESGFKDTFFRQDEDLMFGEAKIKSVAYYFREGKLYRVGIAYEGRVNQFFLKDMLMQTYGPGRALGTRYGWMWANFSIDLTYSDDKKNGALYYTFEGSLK